MFLRIAVLISLLLVVCGFALLPLLQLAVLAARWWYVALPAAVLVCWLTWKWQVVWMRKHGLLR
jgi:hypothetical protein